jgi:hypothetical protein
LDTGIASSSCDIKQASVKLAPSEEEEEEEEEKMVKGAK